MQDEYLMVFISAPPEAGRPLAQALVEEEAAACVQILSGITSLYRWEGKIESDQEVILLVKTLRSCLPRIESLLEKLHPYQVPELLALPVAGGSQDYLKWLSENVAPCRTEELRS